MTLLNPLARPIIGHRGASGRYPENTLLAFRSAIEAGAHALELDVRLSADGVPVVIHDATVDRTTDGRGPVGARSLDQLKQLDAGRGERVPAFHEVLDAFPRVPLLVELKETAVAAPVVEALRARRRLRSVLVGAFSVAPLRTCRSAGVPTAASRIETTLFWGASRLWARAPGRRYEAFSVPERSSGVRVVDRRFVRAAGAARVPVHVWTVDDRDEAIRLRGLGVAGIITNYPERMLGLPS